MPLSTLSLFTVFEVQKTIVVGPNHCIIRTAAAHLARWCQIGLDCRAVEILRLSTAYQTCLSAAVSMPVEISSSSRKPAHVVISLKTSAGFTRESGGGFRRLRPWFWVRLLARWTVVCTHDFELDQQLALRYSRNSLHCLELLLTVISQVRLFSCKAWILKETYHEHPLLEEG